jgi:hypothetical protein
MKFAQVHEERLRKLAHFLKTEDIRFEYTSYARCAIGQCPKVFPEDWHIRETIVDILGKQRTMMYPRIINTVDIGESLSRPTHDAATFFGISFQEARYLFHPHMNLFSTPEETSSPGMYASKEEVAEHILNFISRKLEQVTNERDTTILSVTEDRKEVSLSRIFECDSEGTLIIHEVQHLSSTPERRVPLHHHLSVP